MFSRFRLSLVPFFPPASPSASLSSVRAPARSNPYLLPLNGDFIIHTASCFIQSIGALANGRYHRATRRHFVMTTVWSKFVSRKYLSAIQTLPLAGLSAPATMFNSQHKVGNIPTKGIRRSEEHAPETQKPALVLDSLEQTVTWGGWERMAISIARQNNSVSC